MNIDTYTFHKTNPRKGTETNFKVVETQAP